MGSLNPKQLSFVLVTLTKIILAKERRRKGFRSIIPQAHTMEVNYTKHLRATIVIGFPWRPVLKAPSSSISPLPGTVSFSVTCSNMRNLSGQCCQEIIGSLVWDRGKVSIGLSNWEAEAPGLDPGSILGKVFVAATSVRKICPARRTIWKQVVSHWNSLWWNVMPSYISILFCKLLFPFVTCFKETPKCIRNGVVITTSSLQAASLANPCIPTVSPVLWSNVAYIVWWWCCCGRIF